MGRKKSRTERSVYPVVAADPRMGGKKSRTERSVYPVVAADPRICGKNSATERSGTEFLPRPSSAASGR